MRELESGMGQAVAKRTVLRKIEGQWEDWGDVADRVAAGNVSLAPGGLGENMEEFEGLRDHIANGRILMSGRHLQHGDMNQKFRNMEVFTNCATACTSTASYELLLNGSGVGRCYDDDMMVVDWDKAPRLHLAIARSHDDYEEGLDEFLAALFLGDYDPDNTIIHTVHDSREGWAKALELYETMTYLGQSDKVLVLDFSNVRPSGAPINGMQGRPSSGPVPTMQAFKNIRDQVVGKGYPKWKQAMMVDHFMAESVLVGGARRAARIATKYWKDPDILDFISIKKDGGLWSANNSVGVDEEFWVKVSRVCNKVTNNPTHAREVFSAITSASYHDGEPGFLNLHKLNFDETNLDWDELKKGEYVGSKKYQVEPEFKQLLGEIAGRVEHKKWKAIVNPCGEIVLNVLGGFCVIADVVPYHCKEPTQLYDAVRYTVRSLIRVNTMDSIYRGEVLRTNRIGVGLTGIHEFGWGSCGCSFNDLTRAGDVSQFAYLIRAAREWAEDEAVIYSEYLGLTPPHTVTTIKPAGTTSKLFGLTEGCHLPAMEYYMRWVQKRMDDPLVEEYREAGYPVKELTTYKGMVAVGFPTKPLITDLIPHDKLVTAGQATMDEQFDWLKLLEENWLGPDKGNQISYTLKFNPSTVSLEDFQREMLRVQEVRCVSVLPQVDISVYEYLPEEEITKEEYEMWMSKIHKKTDEDIGREHVECGAGGCPVDIKE